MQLNIYNVSHPIIKLLSNVIWQKKQNPIISSYYYNNLGLLLMYEILRKHIIVKRVYIKHIHSTKLLNLVNNKIKYIIITDLLNNYEMLTNIKMLLPNIEIIDINYENILKENNSKNTEIFIFEKQLKSSNILELIKYLKLKHSISVKNINVACIISYQHTLNELGYEYPKLKVYTTEII